MAPGKEELAKRYAAYTNDRLLDIVYNKQDYTPDAIDAAQAEINNRKIVIDEVKSFVESKAATIKASLVNVHVPLEFWEKVLFFFGWFLPGLVTFAFRLNYDEDGFETKIVQSRFFRIAGFVSFALIVVLTVLLDLGNWSGLAILISFFGVSYWLAGNVFGKKD